MAMLDLTVVSAIARKDMRQYLGNPTGYVFLTLFISATAVAAFFPDEFFTRNLADLAQLNQWMPAILMFFVPAITMSGWSDERRAGTEELLLTMPIRDAEVALGKYLGVLGMFTVSLLFSIANVLVLAFLGDPDIGLMVSTYVGYWLLGGLFCAVGLTASMFTATPTVAFILGALGCAGLVFADASPAAAGMLVTILVGLTLALVWVTVKGEARGAGGAALVGAAVASLLWIGDLLPTAESTGRDNPIVAAGTALSANRHFASFGEGVIQFGDIVYFVGGVAVLLYLSSFLLGRRTW